MKKRTLITLLSLFPVLLSGCASAEGDGIFVINDYETEVGLKEPDFRNISFSELKQKKETGETFALFSYSIGCSSCEETSKMLLEYMKDYPYVIYKITVDASTKEKMAELDEYAFGNLATPNLHLFDDGHFTYNFGSSNLDNLRQFTRLNRTRMLPTSIKVISTLEGYKKYIDSHDDSLLFFYDYSNYETYLKYLGNIQEIAFKYNDKNVALFDKNTIENPVFSEILQESGINDETNYTYLVHRKNGQNKTAINYMNDGDDFISTINDYFRID